MLAADVAHIAGLIAGGAHPSPVGHADVVSTTTHKTLRGPRGAMLLCDADRAAAVDRAVFPGLQGGPHDHTTAAIAVALHEAAQPEFAAYARAVVANAAALAARADRARVRARLRRDRQPPAARRPHRPGRRRAARGRGAGAGGPRLQLQRRPVRSAAAARPVRHPAGHAGADHARPAPRAHARARGLDRRGRRGGAAGGRGGAGADPRRGARARAGVPAAGVGASQGGIEGGVRAVRGHRPA